MVSFHRTSKNNTNIHLQTGSIPTYVARHGLYKMGTGKFHDQSCSFLVEETIATYSITTERSKLRVVHLTLSWCFGDAILVCLLLGNRFRTSCFWLSGEFEYSSCSHSDKGISPMADSNFLPPRGPAPPMCWLAIGSPGHLMATAAPCR